MTSQKGKGNGRLGLRLFESLFETLPYQPVPLDSGSPDSMLLHPPIPVIVSCGDDAQLVVVACTARLPHYRKECLPISQQFTKLTTNLHLVKNVQEISLSKLTANLSVDSLQQLGLLIL
ncbi:uncharacterized protein FFFS_09033 [Fusarium fujikuroi]|nr:uncharacterized protein FFFS_09033 [Fusarium fujikuroi]